MKQTRSRKDLSMPNNKDFIVDLTEQGLFSGLYNSIWLHDETLNDYLKEIAEKLKERYKRDIKGDFYISFKTYLEKIAEVYINCFENEISNSKWEIERVSSPREYNFETDHIILKWINAPENAEERFNNFLEEIDNDYVDFENFTIYDFHCGYEIVHELAEFHDWDGNPITFNNQGQPIIQKFEVKTND